MAAPLGWCGVGAGQAGTGLGSQNGHIHRFSFTVDNSQVIIRKFNLTRGEDKANMLEWEIVGPSDVEEKPWNRAEW
jgi:hypothetical protein